MAQLRAAELLSARCTAAAQIRCKILHIHAPSFAPAGKNILRTCVHTLLVQHYSRQQYSSTSYFEVQQYVTTVFTKALLLPYPAAANDSKCQVVRVVYVRYPVTSTLHIIRVRVRTKISDFYVRVCNSCTQYTINYYTELTSRSLFVRYHTA